jgi:ribonuclease VapC
MVLDTSAIIAILFAEPERDAFARILATEVELAMSVVTFNEASIVTAGKKQNQLAAQLVDDFVQDLSIEIVPLGVEGSLATRAAYFRFGRGYHAAGLNFGDCYAYALAKTRDESLLFKGEDFLKTDIVAAWRP